MICSGSIMIEPLYPSQVFSMMPDSSDNPRHEILGSFSCLIAIMLILERFSCAFVRLLTLCLRQGPFHWSTFVY